MEQKLEFDHHLEHMLNLFSSVGALWIQMSVYLSIAAFIWTCMYKFELYNHLKICRDKIFHFLKGRVLAFYQRPADWIGPHVGPSVQIIFIYWKSIFSAL